MGDVLTFGQQAVYATLAEAKGIIGHYGIPLRELATGFDTKPKALNPNIFISPHVYSQYTNEQALLTVLGADRVYACDVSKYENPDFTFDLSYPVPKELHERFDTILDFGTLEHVFDIATGLANVCRLCKKGGSIVLGHPASNAIDHGFYSFSPTLYFDFFGANGFSDMRCYLRTGSPFVFNKPGKLFRYKAVGGRPLVSTQGVEVVFVARKERSLAPEDLIIKPIQDLYSGNSECKRALDRSSQAKAAHPIQSRIKDLGWRIVRRTERCYPYWLQRLVYIHLRRRNEHLEYLGKY